MRHMIKAVNMELDEFVKAKQAPAWFCSSSIGVLSNYKLQWLTFFWWHCINWQNQVCMACAFHQSLVKNIAETFLVGWHPPLSHCRAFLRLTAIICFGAASCKAAVRPCKSWKPSIPKKKDIHHNNSHEKTTECFIVLPKNLSALSKCFFA